VSAPSPVSGLSRRMFQHGFGKFVVEVGEQRPVDEKRLPTPGLSAAGDLPVAHRHIRCPFRPAHHTEGREDRTNQIDARTKTGLRVQVRGSGRYQRVVQHTAGLEHAASAGGPFEYIYSQPGARFGVHHFFRSLAGANDHGWRSSPPEPQLAESRRTCRTRCSIINGEIVSYSRGRPEHYFHHFAGWGPLLKAW